jgi:hypothetical protein
LLRVMIVMLWIDFASENNVPGVGGLNGENVELRKLLLDIVTLLAPLNASFHMNNSNSKFHRLSLS